jgi:hypothetical protein
MVEADSCSTKSPYSSWLNLNIFQSAEHSVSLLANRIPDGSFPACGYSLSACEAENSSRDSRELCGFLVFFCKAPSVLALFQANLSFPSLSKLKSWSTELTETTAWVILSFAVVLKVHLARQEEEVIIGFIHSSLFSKGLES